MLLPKLARNLWNLRQRFSILKYILSLILIDGLPAWNNCVKCKIVPNPTTNTNNIMMNYSHYKFIMKNANRFGLRSPFSKPFYSETSWKMEIYKTVEIELQIKTINKTKRWKCQVVEQKRDKSYWNEADLNNMQTKIHLLIDQWRQYQIHSEASTWNIFLVTLPFLVAWETRQRLSG